MMNTGGEGRKERDAPIACTCTHPGNKHPHRAMEAEEGTGSALPLVFPERAAAPEGSAFARRSMPASVNAHTPLTVR